MGGIIPKKDGSVRRFIIELWRIQFKH